MSKNLLASLAVVLSLGFGLSACLEPAAVDWLSDSEDAECDGDVTLLGGCVPPGGSTGPSRPDSLLLGLGDDYPCGSGCSIALGGASTLFVGAGGGEELEVSISNGF